MGLNRSIYHFSSLFGIFYFAGFLLTCIGSIDHGRSPEGGPRWKSYVSKFGKEYPSLNNKWSVNEFVGRGDASFDHIDHEFEKLNLDAKALVDMLNEISPASKHVLMTVNEVEGYLGRWKAVMYLLQKVNDKESTVHDHLPTDTMREAASGQMEALFEDASLEMPGLLERIDLQIRTPDDEGTCILCKYVAKKIEEMNLVSTTQIGLNVAVNKSTEFLQQLMKLQVRGTLLYDMTCSPEDIACRQKIVFLERALQDQSQRLSNCTPMLMEELSQRPDVERLYMVSRLSNRILYIPETMAQLTSQKGTLNMDRAKTKGCAMKCGHENRTTKDPPKWSIVDASLYGNSGYFIRGEDGCYLGFDRSFLTFIKDGLKDNKAAGAEVDEVLLCMPVVQPSRLTQAFTIEPITANYTTSYKLKNVLTRKYLRAVRTPQLLTDKTTGGYVVNLVLQACEDDQLGCKWGITKDLPLCEVRPKTDFMDMVILKLYLLLMGVLFLMLISSLVVIWLYRKKIRNDYLQYRRVNTQDIVIPPSYRFPSRT